MRLGFSVAAHIQADVLLLDEVFAVGDEEFQRKCFGKIAEFKNRGGTIVFVSHDAQAVERLCDRAVLLRQGEVAFDGPTREAIAAYRRLLAADANPDELAAGLREWGSGEARIVSAQLLDADGDERSQFAAGEPVTVRCRRLGARRASPAPLVSLELRDDGGLVLGGVSQATAELGWDGARGRARASLPDRPAPARRRPLPPPLRAGRRRRAAGCCTRSTTRCGSSSSRPAPSPGAVLLDGDWTMQEIGDRRANRTVVSTRACPDWPQLMEIAPSSSSGTTRCARRSCRPTRSSGSRASTSTPSRSAATSRPRLQPEHTDPAVVAALRARTGSTCARPSPPAPTERRPSARPPVAVVRAVATVVVPFRGSEAKRRLEPISDGDRVRIAEAMLEDVLDAARAVGRVFVVALDEQALPDGVDRGRRPAARAGRRRSRRRSTRRSSAGSPAPYLVVNADLPCVTARDLLALAGAVPEDGLALAPAADGTTNALGARRREPLQPALRPRQRGALRRARRRRGSSRRRISIDDVDTVADLAPARLAARPRTRVRARRAARARPPREGRRALGRRRRRAVPARPGRRRRPGRRLDHRQRRRRHRGARPPRLARPRQHPLHARRPSPTRSAAGAAPTRPGTRSRRSPSSAASRGSGSATAISGCISCARSCCAKGRPLSEATEQIAHALGLRAGAAAGDRRPAAHVPRDAGRARSRSRRGSSRAATATRSTPCTTRARPRPSPRRACSRRSQSADVIVIAPSNPYVSIGPILAVEEIRAALVERGASRASPSARWSAAAR